MAITAMKQDTTPRLLTRSDLAERLSVSLRTVDALLASGRLPHFRLGRSVRFASAEVDALLESIHVEAKIQTTAAWVDSQAGKLA
jgi:excisionase family DNA binding protein